MDPRQLCRYNMFIRPAYVDAVLSLGWDEASKDRGASFGSLKNILLHIWDVELWHLHYVAEGRAAEAPDWDYDTFTTIESFTEARTMVEAKTQAFLDRLTDADLERQITYERPDDTPIDYSLGQVLVHVATEEVHHRGELIALLWQIDREPPPMTFMRYIRHTRGLPK